MVYTLISLVSMLDSLSLSFVCFRFVVVLIFGDNVRCT